MILEQSEAGTLTIRSGDCRLELSDLEYPHGDALALYRATLFGAGLEATGSVEAIGDDGLAEFLSDIAESALWEGERTWRALSGLELRAFVNDRGNVTATFLVHGRAWDPPWSASCQFKVDLGDFRGLSTEVRRWFVAGAPG
ncbi:MAG: hypothetical protein GY701_33680 [Sulfitobacter sp.]|nr:hypothetical protein [Sulfitobacter sp.]